MDQTYQLTTEERSIITEIQDSLIEQYVKQKEALDKGQKTCVIEIQREINELHREIMEIKEWAKVWARLCQIWLGAQFGLQKFNRAK
jgi:hypothetical protein